MNIFEFQGIIIKNKTLTPYHVYLMVVEYNVTLSLELYLNSRVPVLEGEPSPLEFYREWVAPNKPVILRGLTQHWPAISKWTPDYLRSLYLLSSILCSLYSSMLIVFCFTVSFVCLLILLPAFCLLPL